MVNNSKMIWIVDDDPDDQFFMRRAFGEVPVPVCMMDDGDEVVNALESTHQLPNLIILDINMGRMNGLQTLVELSRNPSFQVIPVVMLTTSDNPKDQAKSAELGAREYYVKPHHYKGMVDLANQISTRWLS